MVCGYQELGLDAYSVGTHKQEEIPILLIYTHEEILVPQAVPQMAAVGISGTDGSEQPQKEMQILLLHPYLPVTFLPTITPFAVICTIELLFKLSVIKIVTPGAQVPSGPQVNPL